MNVAPRCSIVCTAGMSITGSLFGMVILRSNVVTTVPFFLSLWSVEDGGEDICFCIYAYNVQPGIVIDYLTGDNYATDGEKPKDPNTEPSYAKYLLDEDVTGTYVLNTKKKKFHRPDCQGVNDIAPENREEYTGSRNGLVEEGYVPCGGCNP